MGNTAQDMIARHSLRTPAGVSISHESYGAGPDLVIVHGSFSDHLSNWQFVGPSLAEAFTVHALARRGRGETDATTDHSVEEEAADVAALIEAIGGPVHLLGHSYGALIALAAAPQVRDRIGKMVLYEPPLQDSLRPERLAELEDLAAADDWDGFTSSFMRHELGLSDSDLDGPRESPFWPQFVAAAPPTLQDLRALPKFDLDPDDFSCLSMPVMLQIGTQSQRDAYATDSLARVLPGAMIAELPGQGHDAVFTAPDLYAGQVIDFLRR